MKIFSAVEIFFLSNAAMVFEIFYYTNYCGLHELLRVIREKYG